MFNFFKRTKFNAWELNLILNILKKLPVEYKHYSEQIENGIFKGVLTNISDIEGYIGFSLNSKIFEKYYKQKERNFKLTSILVFDLNSNKYIDFNLYFSNGVINGYSTDKKLNPNIDKVDISSLKKINLDSIDFNKLTKILTKEEINLLNPSDVYLIELNGREYYHLKDLEDGDFIGIDLNKNLFKITHDPLIATKINMNLAELMI